MQIKCAICNSNKECQLLFSYNTELSLFRCLDCGLVFLFPEPVITDTKEIYSNLEKYTSLPENHFSIIKKFKFKMAFWRHCGFGRAKTLGILSRENLARAIEILIGKVTPFTLSVPLLQPLNSNQLDIGCGHGSWLLSMHDLGYKNLYGIDIRETAASERLRQKGIPVIIGDILEVDLPNVFFDVIRLEHVIEHLPNPKERLRKIANWLKPSGKIVMSFPNINSYTFKYFGKDTIALELPEHLYHFSPKSISILAEQCGLHLLEHKSIPVFDQFTSSWRNLLKNKGKEDSLSLNILRNKLLYAFAPLYSLIFSNDKGDFLSVLMVRNT
jgi:2-polyprenyl-3-methyl-5-hydroxy-6-metoxy-1,4-benzoquinol methylase